MFPSHAPCKRIRRFYFYFYRVKVIVARGKEDMTIKIMDEGGGIRRSDLQHVWSYMYSTAPKPSPSQLGGVPLDHMSGKP